MKRKSETGSDEMQLPFDMNALILRDQLGDLLKDLVVKKNEQTGELLFVFEFHDNQTEEEREQVKEIVSNFLTGQETIFEEIKKQLDFYLNLGKFEENLIDKVVFEESYHVQYVFKFENGWGASVIKGIQTYGGRNNLWEIALLKFKEGEEGFIPMAKGPTPFEAQEPIGYLSEEKVLNYLKMIKNFKESKIDENE